MLLVEIMYWEMNGCYPSLLVVVAHQRPVGAAVVDVDLSLDVQDAGDAGFHHGLGVLFDLWVWTDENVGVTDLIEGETTYEISIRHLNMAIDNESLLDISPDVRAGCSELTSVIIGIL